MLISFSVSFVTSFGKMMARITDPYPIPGLFLFQWPSSQLSATLTVCLERLAARAATSPKTAIQSFIFSSHPYVEIERVLKHERPLDVAVLVFLLDCQFFQNIVPSDSEPLSLATSVFESGAFVKIWCRELLKLASDP